MERDREVIRAFNQKGVLTIWKFNADSEDGLPVGEVSRTVERSGEYQQCYFCKRILPIEQLQGDGRTFICNDCIT